MAKKIIKGIGIPLLLIIILVILFVVYLVNLHNQPLILPTPTGPYPIGRTAYNWLDESRIDTLSDKSDEKRELLAWVWYPAAKSSTGLNVPYVPPEWARARERDQGIGKFIESNLSLIQTHSYENTPISEIEAVYPVIIMQPGMGPVPTDYTVFAENLASHGFIVIGINPTYSSNMVVFMDGRIALRTDKGTIPDNANAADMDQDAVRIGKVWTQDAIFVMDQLQTIDADPESFLYHKLDLAHIGFFGHSFGGATAASVCKIDPRCRAGVDLDGTLFSYQANGTFQVPFMFMEEDGCGEDCETMRQGYASSTGTAYYLSIKGARHLNFSDLPLRLLLPIRILYRMVGFIGSVHPERDLEITNTYLVAFFNKHLKNIDSELLKGPSSKYQNIEFSMH